MFRMSHATVRVHLYRALALVPCLRLKQTIGLGKRHNLSPFVALIELFTRQWCPLMDKWKKCYTSLFSLPPPI